MAINKLKAGHLKTKGPAKLGDGGGLWLYISKSNSRRWVFRYSINGKTREMGLGSVDAVSLTKARKLAAECRGLRAEGKDPIALRQEKEVKTFDACASDYIKAHRAGWSPLYAQGLERSLKRYASPAIGSMPVDAITTDHVSRIIEPLWYEHTVLADSLRNRIERVLSLAKAKGYRNGENPAAWRDNFEHLLPKRARIHKKRHFPAMPYRNVGEFMQGLPDTIAGQTVRFLILTASRAGAVLRARWDEIDGDVWVCPAGRMKGRVEHRVPLSRQAMDLLNALPRESEWLFPSPIRGKSLSRNSVAKMMDGTGYTLHGFRSTFSDWAAEQTSFPSRVAEYALAHKLEDEVEASYQRSTLFEKRRLLMQEWANYLDLVESNVVRLHG